MTSKCCYCKTSPILGDRYVYKQIKSYSACAYCAPNGTDWKLVRRKAISWPWNSGGHSYYRCHRSIRRGKRFVYKKNKCYSVCKNCIHCYNRHEWKCVNNAHKSCKCRNRGGVSLRFNWIAKLIFPSQKCRC